MKNVFLLKYSVQQELLQIILNNILEQTVMYQSSKVDLSSKSSLRRMFVFISHATNLLCEDK